MAKKSLNLDTESRIHDAISFTFKGEDYTCVALTDDLMDHISKLADDDTLRPGDLLSRQLGAFTGTDPSEFADMSFQQRTAALDHILECITDPLGKKRQRASARR